MKKLLDTTEKMFSREEATRIANELNTGDLDDWTYEAVHDPKGTGFSFINVYDEEGTFVAKV